MGNRHHVIQYGRNESIRWPEEPNLSADEQLALTAYRQCEIEPSQIAWLADHSRRMLANRKAIGVVHDGELIAVIRSRFPGSDAKLYLRDGRIETVIDGFAGVELKNINRSLLVLHEMLSRPVPTMADQHHASFPS